MIYLNAQSQSPSPLVLCLLALCLSCSADPANSQSAASGGAPAASGGAPAASAGAPVGGAPVGSGGGTSGGNPSAGSGGAGGSVNPLGRARCRPPAGTSGSPRTIEEAVALMNALPKPTSMACFVESLERPFTAYATSSQFSAQPAFSARSPRVFIKLDRLWLSIVMDGDSSELLELSYLLDESRSIKGELKAPVTELLAPSAPYDRVRRSDVQGTLCALCHYGEERVESITFAEAFASIPFRPRPDTRVGLDGLALEARSCDWAAEPHRCEMLSALFDGGIVTEESFPSTMPTFF